MSTAVLLPALAVVALVAGLVAALAPRSAAGDPAADLVTDPTAHDRARRHAAVVAAAAWGALALVAVALPAAAPEGRDGGVVLACAPAAAALAFLLLAAVGERTWPSPGGAVRRASLGRRTAADVAPRTLLAALASWATGLLLVLLATGLSAGTGGRTVDLVLDEHASSSAGPYPGAPYGVPLAVATALVLAATLGVLHLVARRPAVADLSVADDAALRTAAGGRVLAGVQLAVGGTLAGVLLFAGQALRSAAHASYAVDDVWTTVTDPTAAALGLLALGAAPLVAVAAVALAATGLARAARTSARPVAA